jgi:5,5'-dehydrodivanillate O-demethylase
MLTKEENDFLTRVGPGTPGGELLRRYWYPVAVAQDLTPEHPTKFVRLLAEDLVLFLDKSGNVGLLGDHCPHRSASLVYGRVEERGLSCAYHGWLMDTCGNILETPPERNDAIMKSVKQKAYPVRRFIGMYWAYLGPLPAPEIPRYDVWARSDGHRKIVVHPNLDCNWLQPMENSVDPAHLQVLHQEFIGGQRKPVSTTRGFTDDVEGFDFWIDPATGTLMKKRTYKTGYVEEHPVLFPNILRQGINTQIRVPIDDTHTAHIFVGFEVSGDGSVPENEGDPAVTYLEPYKDPAEASHPEAHYLMNSVLAQDHAMWETQGPLTDRSVEHLSYSDRGVALLRKILKENIETVQRGGDPLGVIRDPDHGIIDTNLEAASREQVASRGERVPVKA